MRLIDADELEKVMTEDWFLEILATKESKKDIKDMLANMIDSVPLAYDIKNVVGELDEQARKSLEKYKESFELFQEEYWRGNMNGFGKAIEIVKGGVDNG
jgi:hypothetical protein